MELKHTPVFLATFSALLSIPGVFPETVTYQGFASTVSCTGSHFQCTDGGAVCCSFPTGFGFSVQFNNLPAGTQGQGYTKGGCSDFLFALFGPGTKCWNGGGSSATNMNWFHSPQRSRRNVWDITVGGTIENSLMNCSAPSSFTYEMEGGVERRIRVPMVDGAARTIAELYLANDLESLAAYEDL